MPAGRKPTPRPSPATWEFASSSKPQGDEDLRAAAKAWAELLMQIAERRLKEERQAS